MAKEETVREYPREMYRLASSWDNPDHQTAWTAEQEEELGKEWVDGHVFYSRPKPKGAK